MIPLRLRAGSKLIRGVINWNKGRVEEISHLSYKPASSNTQYSRASIPGETMFYTCPFTHSPTFENGIFIPRLTSLMEIRSIITEVKREGIQRVTFSRWDSTKEILLFAVPFLSVYKKACDEVLDIQKKWERIVYNNLYKTDSIELIKYLSEDISTPKVNNTDYMFTALFINWFLSRHPEYSGVFYPSVQTEGEGANIAFEPRIIDSGYLRFVEATECWIIKRGMYSEMVTAYQLLPHDGKLIHFAFDVEKQLDAIPHPISLDGLSFLN